MLGILVPLGTLGALGALEISHHWENINRDFIVYIYIIAGPGGQIAGYIYIIVYIIVHGTMVP